MMTQPTPLPRIVRTARALLVTMAAAITLAACQSVPPPSGFSAAQKTVLTANGFVETTRGWELTMADRVLFDVNDSLLKPEQIAVLANVGAQLAKVGIASASVEGHTDNTGSDAFNIRLSQARAQSVAVPLRANGIALATNQIVGRGESFPVGDNETDAGRADNRRVVVIVTP